jgi:uncharacterized protein
LARVAARDGAPMVLIALKRDGLDALAAELAAGGVQAHALAIDLAEHDAGQKLENELADRDLCCDVLVNCAGIGVFGPVAESDREANLRLLDVNIRVATELTLRFLPGMVARRRGGVLNIGSITGYVPGPNMATYYASKAYLRSFSAAVSAEVAGSGVTVTCVAPGVVRTAFFEGGGIGETRLFKMAPRANADETAEAAWRAFKAGKRLYIPRLINRMIVATCLLLPDALLLRIVARYQRLREPRA